MSLDGHDPGRPGTGATRGPRPLSVRRRGALLGPVVTILVAAALALVGLAELWIRWRWFSSVGAEIVFWRRLATQAALFLATGMFTGALVASSLAIARRTRPVLAAFGPRASLSSGRGVPGHDEPVGGPSRGSYSGPPAMPPLPASMGESLRRLVQVAVPLVVGVLSGVAAASQWRLFLAWWYRRPFGRTDSHFGLDLAFFAVELPWWQLVVDLALLSTALAALAAAMAHYVHGGLRPGPGARSSTATVVHLSVLLAVLCLLQAVRYWLDRYELAVRDDGIVPGLTYVGAHALVPGKAVLAASVLVCGLLFLGSIRSGSWRLPTVAVAVLAVCAFVVGTVYPAVVQWGVVGSDVRRHELPQAAQALATTRFAYGLEHLEHTPLLRGADASASPAAPAGAATAAAGGGATTAMPTRELAAVAGSVPLVAEGTLAAQVAARRWVGGVPTVSPAVGPGATGRRATSGSDLHGEGSDTGAGPVVVAPRLPPAPADDATWEQRHVQGAAASGVMVAELSRTAPDGTTLLRALDSGGSSDSGGIGGSGGSSDSGGIGGTGGIVSRFWPGADDYAVDRRGAAATGVDLTRTVDRVAAGIALRDIRLMTPSPGARLLDHRSPLDRVARVAPWLDLDSHPYAVVAGGRLLWVVDGYTTASLPGAARVDMGELGRDSSTSGRPVRREGLVGYVRNAVKATVDASDGTVRLYAWDVDPVEAAWEAAMPGLVHPASAMPAGLAGSLRYPQDLFRAQRAVLQRFHVTRPEDLLDPADVWPLAPDTTSAVAQAGVTPTRNPPAAGLENRAGPVDAPDDAPPPALLAAAGDLAWGSRGAGVMTSVLVDSSRTRTAAVLAASPVVGARHHAALRLLEPPTSSSPPSPRRVADRMAVLDTPRAGGGPGAESLAQLTVRLTAAGDTVVRGPATTVPVGGSTLVVQPVYATRGAGRASTGASAGPSSSTSTPTTSSTSPPGSRSGVTSSLSPTASVGPSPAAGPGTQTADGQVPLGPRLVAVVAAYGDTLAWSRDLGGAVAGLSATADRPGAPSTPALREAIAEARRASQDLASAQGRGDADAVRSAQSRLETALREAAGLVDALPVPSPAAPTPSTSGPSRPGA